jgi:class 3 adenylate cyclase
MFIDIAGFTSMSEKINHERALFLLNLYFDGIGEIILRNK